MFLKRLKRLDANYFPLSVTITHEIMCSLMLIGGQPDPRDKKTCSATQSKFTRCKIHEFHDRTFSYIVPRICSTRTCNNASWLEKYSGCCPLKFRMRAKLPKMLEVSNLSTQRQGCRGEKFFLLRQLAKANSQTRTDNDQESSRHFIIEPKTL